MHEALKPASERVGAGRGKEVMETKRDKGTDRRLAMGLLCVGVGKCGETMAGA